MTINRWVTLVIDLLIGYISNDLQAEELIGMRGERWRCPGRPLTVETQIRNGAVVSRPNRL